MSKGNMRRHLALFDLHGPHNIDLTPVLAFAKDYAPTDFIIGGDFLNHEWCSHWNEHEFKYIGLEKISKMFDEEMAFGRNLLAQIIEALPTDCNKYFIPGNHEDWLYWACLTYPAIAGGLRLGVENLTYKSDLANIRKVVLANLITKFLETDRFNIKVLPLDKELTLGKITYLHGHNINSMTALKKRYPARNIVIGHHHTHLVETLHNSGDSKRANQYVFAPCLCKLSPGFLKDSSTRWLQGIWTADVLPGSGHFDGRVVKVIDGCIMYGGKIYK